MGAGACCSLSLCGMAIGLAIDCGSTPPEILASLCVAASSSLAASLRVHLEVLPATHLMMLAGAALAAAMMETTQDRGWRDHSLRAMVARNLPGAAGAAAMVVGMVIGGWLGPPLAVRFGIASGFARLTIAMVLGMASGMIIATPLYRLALPVRSRRRGQTRRQAGGRNSAAPLTCAPTCPRSSGESRSGLELLPIFGSRPWPLKKPWHIAREAQRAGSLADAAIWLPRTPAEGLHSRRSLVIRRMSVDSTEDPQTPFT